MKKLLLLLTVLSVACISKAQNKTIYAGAFPVGNATYIKGVKPDEMLYKGNAKGLKVAWEKKTDSDMAIFQELMLAKLNINGAKKSMPYLISYSAYMGYVIGARKRVQVPLLMGLGVAFSSSVFVTFDLAARCKIFFTDHLAIYAGYTLQWGAHGSEDDKSAQSSLSLKYPEFGMVYAF